MEIENKKFHFIAVGGVGMSALAKYLAQKGAEVSGTDIVESKYTHQLKSLGVKIGIGQNANNIKDGMIIVASSAIKENNPEIIRAKELGLKIYHRSDILKMISDEFSNNKDSCFIGFSGTHGKTTTSGLCSYILEKAGLNPSYIVGGIIPDINTNGNYNGNKFFVAELDESDGTIQKYSTDIAVINNIEEDHLDYYVNGFYDIANTFQKYLSNKPEQKVIINSDNIGNRKFIGLYKDYNYITFGLKNADYTARNIKINGYNSSFDVYKDDELLCAINLIIPGMHNVYNSLAVVAALNEAGINTKDIADFFSKFKGMGRRFQNVCNFNNIAIYDDYAHHPQEIDTTLKGASEAKNSNQRIVAIFQPHRYTRLKSLWDKFTECFKYSDKLYITDIYSAGEEAISNIDSEKFSKYVNHNDCKYVSGSMEDCAKKIYPELKENDIVITLGAGDITALGKLLEEEYKRLTCGKI